MWSSANASWEKNDSWWKNCGSFRVPFQLRSFVNKKEFFGCTAALISQNYVLTAGHCCADDIDPELLFQVPNIREGTYIKGKCTRHPYYSHGKFKCNNNQYRVDNMYRLN